MMNSSTNAALRLLWSNLARLSCSYAVCDEAYGRNVTIVNSLNDDCCYCMILYAFADMLAAMALIFGHDARAVPALAMAQSNSIELGRRIARL